MCPAHGLGRGGLASQALGIDGVQFGGLDQGVGDGGGLEEARSASPRGSEARPMRPFGSDTAQKRLTPCAASLTSRFIRGGVAQLVRAAES